MAAFEISASSYPKSFWRVHRSDNIFPEDQCSYGKRCSSLGEGWNAADVTSTPPNDQKNFLAIVKQHFQNHSENNKNSILVTGVWHDHECSPISLFQNREDARMESRRYGDAVVQEIPAEILKKANTRVYGLRKMLTKDKSLKRIVSVAYHSNKLRGNAYLVLHRIPGLREEAAIAPRPVVPKRVKSLGLRIENLEIVVDEDEMEVDEVEAEKAVTTPRRPIKRVKLSGLQTEDLEIAVDDQVEADEGDVIIVEVPDSRK
jgi:hypothetical protein